MRAVGQMKIGFGPGTLMVEAIQGMAAENDVKKTNELLEEPWANCLLTIAESHAKKNGIKRVFIRGPQTLYYYREPVTSVNRETNPEEHRKKVKGIRIRMENLYGRVARANGYRETEGGFVKEL